MASRSLFAANVARTHPRRALPSTTPLSPLSAARQGLAANPIDRSEPLRRSAIEQQRALIEKAESNLMPVSLEEIAFSQPDLDLGVLPFVFMRQMQQAGVIHQMVPAPVIQPVVPAIAPIQPNAVAQQAAQAQTVAPTQPMAPAQHLAPAQQAAPIQQNVVVQQAAQAQTMALTQPMAPAQPVAQAQQAAPAQQARPFNVLVNGVPMNRAQLRRSVSPHEFRRLTTRSRRNHTAAARPAPELSVNQYHEIADSTMGSLLWQLEDLESEREDMEVEEAAGVITMTLDNGLAYVINKQPANKQIWLSSPISGPKRFDYREVHYNGTRVGKWVCGRDNTYLVQILNHELAMQMLVEGEGKQWVNGRYE